MQQISSFPTEFLKYSGGDQAVSARKERTKSICSALTLFFTIIGILLDDDNNNIYKKGSFNFAKFYLQRLYNIQGSIYHL
jgi:hypothetical protein